MKANPLVDRLVSLALEEDLALGDVTTASTIDPSVAGVGRIAAKQALVVAGIDVACRVFNQVDPTITLEWQAADGSQVVPGQVIGIARGPVVTLLEAERTVLNFMQRLCGVATLTRAFADAVEGTGARVVDTRKTTPGWRTLEKAAVVAGGGFNHRFSLGSGVLIKDNHVDAGHGITGAIERARAAAPHGFKIEIEVRNENELAQAIEGGADIALLDNMSLEELTRCASLAREHGVMTEASGGVTLETVRAIAETGVDVISSGALTHSAPSVDIHMKVKKA